MNRAKKQIAALRCSACGRAPTQAERAEMYENFGHKLDTVAPPGELLIWECNRCLPKGVMS